MNSRFKRALSAMAAIGLAATLVSVAGPAAHATPGAQATPTLTPGAVATEATPFSLSVPGNPVCDGTGSDGWRVNTFIVNAGVDLSTLDFSNSGLPSGWVGGDFDSVGDGIVRAPLFKGSSATVNILPANSPAGQISPSALAGFNFGSSSWNLADGKYKIGFACVDGPGTTQQWWSVDVNIDGDGTPLPFMSQEPTVSIGDATIVEGNSGKAAFGFRVTLSQKLAAQASVDYTVTSGSATLGTKPTDPGIDGYGKASGTIVFKVTGSGLTGVQKNISINTLGDTAVEPNETFTITLSNPVGVKLGRAVGTGTIITDDTGGSGMQVSVGDGALVEGNLDKARSLQIPVTLSDVPTGTTSVVWTLTSGSATYVSKPTTAGGDLYGKATGTLTWAAGKPRRLFVTSPILADWNVEASETYTITLSTPSGATIFKGVGTGTVLNDD
jgi:hypothetical protein